MAKRYEAVLSLPVHEPQDTHDLIAMITEAEVEYRDQSRTLKLLNASKLRYHALPEDILCNPERGITREQVFRLSDSMSIERVKNVLITGLPANHSWPVHWEEAPAYWVTALNTLV